ncbi:hypothetical protein SPBR_00364 [Sporothrix brasiliensis 5110]|uniref:Lpxtg-domain-containing protein n=1 Tax=Sporothrix brasiliensis 5110 TaxID=1398154 RepID=A0A0C2IP94_9PEZI|nr:uncharacterized protein SPBR_00364 [Sporothrix brasiliensis 5110]KIH90851.1 hypothetical protein SPBR_00364 [Sporothrix brasiliensis 5110]
MWPSKLALVTVGALVGPATALLVAPNSPCEQYCGNVLSATTGSDMTCDDSLYSSSSAGIVFESCINCELKSAYSTGNVSDLQYLLYNLRYTISYCLFGLENNTNVAGSPCITNPACGLLENSFNYENLTVDVAPYGYCDGWIEVQVPKCTACLGSGFSNSFMENYVTILDAACIQKPNAGTTLSVSGTPFSTIPMNVTTPSAVPLYTYTPAYSAISLGGKVGIAIGGLVLLLSFAGFMIVCLGRRRRRAYLKSVEARYRNGGNGGVVGGGSGDGWPSPNIGRGSKAHEKFSTPTSAQPLRGWDDTPTSASTMAEKNGGFFPRYFSPYNSQYNSPVSAEEGPPYTTWPTMASMTDTLAAGSSSSAMGGAGGRHYALGLRSVSPVADDAHDGSPGSSSGANGRKPWPPGYTQEEIERMAHEYELAQIGVALGGADPSLRSKNSNVSLEGSAGAKSAVDVNDFPTPPLQQAPTQTGLRQQSLAHHGESSSPSSLSPSSLSSLSVSAGALWEQPSSSSSKRKTRRSSKKSSSTRQASEPSDNESIILSTFRRPSATQEQSQIAEPQPPPAPTLQPPRAIPYYPPPPSPQMESPYSPQSPYGGLTEEDARHGHAM